MKREPVSSSARLMSEWHPTKNNILTPSDVTAGSGKKVWWQCSKGHEWEASPNGRSRGSGCPYCSKNRPSDDNCLKRLNPTLVEQWHPTKNGDLTPNNITVYSHKKVWWLCEKGHEWQVSVAHRSRGYGCPYCSGKRVCKDNCLQTLIPALAKQWHPTKNGDLTPSHVTIKKDKKVWWLCDKGHEWEARIDHRANGSGCPYCKGLRVCKDNCLQTLIPALAKQWHPTKNGDLTPSHVTIGKDKKVWWLCDKGHEWQARISHRAKGVSCPICNHGSQTSFPEQAIFYYIKKVFDDSTSRYKFMGKWEIDVYIASLKFGIEYDGIYYHQDIEIDLKKDKLLKSEGIKLLRIKETKNIIIDYQEEHNIIYLNENYTDNQFNEVITLCFNYISKKITNKTYHVDININRDRADIYELYLKSEEKESLLTNYPELSKQWHPTKNINVKPNMVRQKSSKKVWWQCEKGHEWQERISHRTNGIGCPFCSGRRACVDNCLQTLNPKLSEQWHPTKNGNLTPSDVTIGSNKKVWWLCNKGHEWLATINDRSRGRGCPYCSGKRVILLLL